MFKAITAKEEVTLALSMSVATLSFVAFFTRTATARLATSLRSIKPIRAAPELFPVATSSTIEAFQVSWALVIGA
jgi:hypothetical protein